MFTVLNHVLSTADLSRVAEITGQGEWIDGRATSVVTRKHNLQIDLKSDAGEHAGALVSERLLAHEGFERAARPARLTQPLLSRYEAGMAYPDHIDAAIMGGLRTNISITVFLNSPEAYDGGELVVSQGLSQVSFRLRAGDAVIYPADRVHHVTPVKQGVRSVAVLWVQSRVPSVRRRSVLADLEACADSCDGSLVGGRVRRSYSNLRRMWTES